MNFSKLVLRKREKKIRSKRTDVAVEQVKKVLENADQQLILMVRN